MTIKWTPHGGWTQQELAELASAMYQWAGLDRVLEMHIPFDSAYTMNLKLRVQYGMPPRAALSVMSAAAPALVERFGTTDLDKLVLVPFKSVADTVPAYSPVFQMAFTTQGKYDALYEIGRQFDVAPVTRPLPDTREMRDIWVSVPWPMPTPLLQWQVIELHPKEVDA